MNDPVTHELGRYGREKDTVSIMPGGRDQSFRARRTKNRKIVRRAGAQARPCFKNFRRFQIRAELHSFPDNPTHSSCCDAFIKTDIFQGASDYDAAIGSWNKIAVLRAKNVMQDQTRFAQCEHLTANGPRRERGKRPTFYSA